jgi:hypothetical protein
MLKKIALSFVSTVISLTIIEIVLRVFCPVYTAAPVSAFQYDPVLGTRLRPNSHILETTDYQQEMKVNSLGTANFQESFDGYRSLVFAVGDSYTEGIGLPSDVSYPAQLDLSLNSGNGGDYAKNYGVVNLGVAGYGGEQNLIRLQEYSKSLGKPAYILYLGCDNDYEDDQLFASGYRHKHFVDGSPTWGWFARPLEWLTGDLQIGLRLKLIIAQLRQSSISENGNGAVQANAPSPAEREAPVLEKLKAFAKENNSVLIVSWFDTGASYDWLKGWASRNQILFADWEPRFDSVRNAIPGIPEENPHSGGHHRGWVNRVIADEYGRIIMSKHS